MGGLLFEPLLQCFDQQIDTPSPEQKAQWLENENEAKSRCQRDAKKCHSAYAMVTPLVYAIVYPEPYKKNPFNFQHYHLVQRGGSWGDLTVCGSLRGDLA